MPGEFETRYDTMNYIKSIEYKSINDGVNYIFKLTRFENNMYHSDSTSNLSFDLNYSQKYFANDQNYTLFGMIIKSIKGYPGKEYRFKHTHKDIINFRRVYIVKNYLIEMIYESTGDKIYHLEIDAFFNSLSLPGYKDNPIPFLNCPSEEEIKSRPYQANFEGDTKQVIEANESEFGNVCIVVEIEERKNYKKDGIIAFGVTYMDFNFDLSKNEKIQVIEGIAMTQSQSYPNFEILNKSISSDISELRYRYTINGKRVVEKRKIEFVQNRIYNINAIFIEDMDESIKVRNFIESVKY